MTHHHKGLASQLSEDLNWEDYVQTLPLAAANHSFIHSLTSDVLTCTWHCAGRSGKKEMQKHKILDLI